MDNSKILYNKRMSAIEDLIKKEKQEIICPSCGARFDIHEARCPYCDTVNEFGDETEYIKSLEDIREDLEETGEYAEEAYASELKSGSKKILIIVIVILCIAGAIAGSIFIADRMMERANRKRTEEIVEWQNENFALLDELYEKEDYDAIFDIRDELILEGKSSALWEWEHFQFLSAYSSYRTIRDAAKDIEDGNRELVMEQWCFECCMSLLCDRWDIKYNTVKSLTKKDYETIENVYAPFAEEYLMKYLGLSKEKIEEIKPRVVFDPPGQGVDYSKCGEVYKEITNEM